MDAITSTTHGRDGRRKSHKLRTTLIVLGAVVVVLALVLGWSGVSNVPLVTAAFGTNQPRDLGVRPGPQDLTTLFEKFPVELAGDLTAYTITGNKTYTGQISVDARHTSEESTAFIQKYLTNDPYVRDLQLKMVEGGVQMSWFQKKPITAPVFADIAITRTSDKSVDLKIRAGAVGRLTVPKKYQTQIEDWLEDVVNRRLAQVSSLTVGRLDYHDGYVDFAGTLPARAEPTAGSWLDLPF